MTDDRNAKAGKEERSGVGKSDIVDRKHVRDCTTELCTINDFFTASSFFSEVNGHTWVSSGRIHGNHDNYLYEKRWWNKVRDQLWNGPSSAHRPVQVETEENENKSMRAKVRP